MSENRGNEETFLAKVAQGKRITIYEPVREMLGIDEGDLLRVTLHVVRRKKTLDEDSPPIEPTEPEEDLEEETPELLKEEPTEEEPPEETEEPLPDILEPEPEPEPEEVVEEEPLPRPEIEEEPLPEELKEEVVEPEVEEPIEEEPEEVSEKGESWGQEHVEPCPKGLDWPLQDIEICQGNRLPTDGKSCEHYKRKYGKSPQKCAWPEWKPIGWEDESEEEPIEDIVEEPTEEKPETEPIDFKITPTKKDNMLLIYCESGVHKPGLIPHEKRDLGDGWAMYTCLSCKKTTPMLISKAEEMLEAEASES